MNPLIPLNAAPNAPTLYRVPAHVAWGRSQVLEHIRMNMHWSADDTCVDTVYSYRNGQDVIVCVYARRMCFIDPTTGRMIGTPLYAHEPTSGAEFVPYNSTDMQHRVHVPVSNHHAFARELATRAG